jgi:ribosomal protein S17
MWIVCIGSTENPESENYGEFVKTYQNRMTEAFQLANSNITKSQDYNKLKYDKKAHSVELDVGDRVLIKNVRPQGTTRKGKLASFWEPVVYAGV